MTMYQYIVTSANHADFKLPDMTCAFERGKIQLEPISYHRSLLLNFFKTNPFYKCNFDELLTRNNVEADDKEILKKEMQYLLSSKRIFNKIFYFNELYKIFQWTFSIITEKYLFHYDAAPKIFFPNVIDSSAP